MRLGPNRAWRTPKCCASRRDRRIVELAVSLTLCITIRWYGRWKQHGLTQPLQRRRTAKSLAMTTKGSLFFICALAAIGAVHADESAIEGQLTFNSHGIGQVVECGTQRVIELGVMASNPYFLLSGKYDEVSAGGKESVLVKLEGRLVSSSEGKLVLESPRMVAMKAGACGNG